MTKLVRVSERDVLNLEKIRQVSSPLEIPQPETYRDVVVVKPWGYEFLVFQNNVAAIWFLHIKQGHSTSMHCHPGKKTSLIVISGQALCNTFYNRNYLSALDAIVIEKGVFHSTKSLSTEGIHLLEIETPPDKTDLLRLDDQYGREGRGYEGLTDMKRDNLNLYNYFDFTKPGDRVQTFNGVEISLSVLDSKQDLAKFFRTTKGEFYCPCDGTLRDASGETVLEVGDSAEGCYLSAFNGLQVDDGAVFLRVRQAHAASNGDST